MLQTETPVWFILLIYPWTIMELRKCHSISQSGRFELLCFRPRYRVGPPPRLRGGIIWYHVARCMEWLFWREKDTLVTRVCRGVSCPISFRVNFTPSPQPFLIWSNFIPKFILFFPHGPHLNLSFIRPCHPFWPFSFILLIMSGKGQLYVIF